MDEQTDLNVVIPMAGLGSRFTDYGFTTNKYLLPVDIHLTKMIERAILTLNIRNIRCCFIFVIRENDGIVDVELRGFLQELCDKHNYQCKIVSVSQLTEGPASTVYVAKIFIDNDIPLIVSNSDQILDWNFDYFYGNCQKYDGCVLTYTPDYELVMGATDKHSFVKLDADNCPVEFTEKKVISKEALVGVHYYKSGRFFIKAYEYLFQNNIRAPNNEFYLSYTYQALLDLGGYSIGYSAIRHDETFYPVGEPSDYFAYYNKFTNLPLYDVETYYNIPREYTFDLYKNTLRFLFMKKGETLNIHSTDLLIIVIQGKIQKWDKPLLIVKENINLLFEEDTFIFHAPLCSDFTKQFSNDIIGVNMDKYTRGWLIGNFEPCIEKSSFYELGLLTHKKGEKWGFHYHKQATEYNVLIKGKMIVNNVIIESGNIFIFSPNHIACPIFLEDCTLICIKVHTVSTNTSLLTDKFII
jgi:dTDP-glucose pyrophosphorylase